MILLSRCAIGAGPINEFVFSPCGQFLAVVSQVGCLAQIEQLSL